jgi:CheY-like chemotaxis protein
VESYVTFGQSGKPAAALVPSLAPTEPSNQPQAFLASQAIRIALVDDDQSIHLAMRQIFKRWAADWTLDSYMDGKEAINSIPRMQPHAVLMDISMPGITGIDCTRKVKAMLPDLPVIMFTARSDTESFVSAMIAGASARRHFRHQKGARRIAGPVPGNGKNRHPMAAQFQGKRVAMEINRARA